MFFSSLEECVEKIKRYLPNQAARARVAAAGHARALRSGYSNDVQMGHIMERLQNSPL